MLYLKCERIEGFLNVFLNFLFDIVLMVSNQVVLFGAKYELKHWKDAFRDSGLSVVYCDLDPMNDVALQFNGNDLSLFVSGENRSVMGPAAGIWRIGAVNPTWDFMPYLELLDAAKDIFPMINPASAHLLCARRVRMLSRLAGIKDFPLVPFHSFVSGRYIIESSFKPEFPLVVKVGNFQGGLMKWKVESRDQWIDFFDSFKAMKMPVIIEKCIEFDTEYRSLFVGDDMYLIERKNIKGWKAQHASSSEIITMIPEIEEMTLKAKEKVDLDIGALDIVYGPDGYTVLEINDAPDINHEYLGIPENLWKKTTILLNEKVKK